MNNSKASSRGIFKYMPLLKELVVRDIKIKYRHSFLGILWTVLNPLLNMLVLTVVFQNLFRDPKITNFALYVMVGNIAFGFLSESTNRGMHSILWNASLIKKVYIPKYLFPLANVMSSLVNFGFSYIAMIFVMIVTKAPFRWVMLTSIIPLLYLSLFALGLSLLLSSINVFFRDMQHIYSVILTIWLYLSAIFYSISRLNQSENGKIVANIIEFNPMYRYITFFRSIIIDGIFPSFSENLVCMLWSVITVAIGALVFNLSQKKFILHI